MSKDTIPHCINILKLQKYNFKFFDLQEVVLFEYLVVKGKAFDFKDFYHSSRTISEETGIRRASIDSALKKFTTLGIIDITLKGMPRVKFFHVNYARIYDLVPQIFQFAENSKLSAESCKLCADFYKLLAENYQQKNINKEYLKNNKENNGWMDGVFDKKILSFKALIDKASEKKKISSAAAKFEITDVLSAFDEFGDDLLHYLETYLNEYGKLAKLSEFLSRDHEDVTRFAFIHRMKEDERENAEKLLRDLISLFNCRRELCNDKKRTYPDTTLLITEAIRAKAIIAQREVDDLAIRNAFVAYADAVMSGGQQVKNILSLFLSKSDGEYKVMGWYLNNFNTNYSIPK